MRGQLKTNYKTGGALCQLSFSDLNTIGNVLNTVGITMLPTGALPEVKRTSASGKDWQFCIPAGGGAGASADLARSDFWYAIVSRMARTVNFNAGRFRHAQARFTVAATVAMVIATSPAHIYLEYPRGGAPVLKQTADEDQTLPDTNAYRELLFTFTIDATTGLNDPTPHHFGLVKTGTYWS